MRKATIIPGIISIRGKMFPCKLGEENYFKKLKYDPFKLCKNSFSTFFCYRHSRGSFFTHFHTQIKNLAKLILSVQGAKFSLNSV
jgi:hypothetical protein